MDEEAYAVLLWSIAAAMAYRFTSSREAFMPAVPVGSAVLSHWIAEFLAQYLDLPLIGNSYKVGLGLNA